VALGFLSDGWMEVWNESSEFQSQERPSMLVGPGPGRLGQWREKLVWPSRTFDSPQRSEQAVRNGARPAKRPARRRERGSSRRRARERPPAEEPPGWRLAGDQSVLRQRRGHEVVFLHRSHKKDGLGADGGSV